MSILSDLFSIEKVASEIIEFFEGINSQSIAMMCVLKGGFRFFADLIDAMERTIRARGTPIPISTDFVRARSYVVGFYVIYNSHIEHIFWWFDLSFWRGKPGIL